MWPFVWSQPLWHTNRNHGQSSAQRVGWLLTAGFRNSAVPSHCCWQEISARHWCAEQELIWNGLLQLKGTGPKLMHGESRDNFSHWFLQFSAVDTERSCWSMLIERCVFLVSLNSVDLWQSEFSNFLIFLTLQSHIIKYITIKTVHELVYPNRCTLHVPIHTEAMPLLNCFQVEMHILFFKELWRISLVWRICSWIFTSGEQNF